MAKEDWEVTRHNWSLNLLNEKTKEGFSVNLKSFKMFKYFYFFEMMMSKKLEKNGAIYRKDYELIRDGITKFIKWQSDEDNEVK